MKALISPHERVVLFDGTVGQRVVHVTDSEYPVAEPLFWVDCDDAATADDHYWDGGNVVIKPSEPVDRPDSTIELP